MMVKKAIMTIGPEVFMTVEKLPDEVKCWLPRSANVHPVHSAPHCRERLRADGLSDNLIVHGLSRNRIIQPQIIAVTLICVHLRESAAHLL